MWRRSLLVVLVSVIVSTGAYTQVRNQDGSGSTSDSCGEIDADSACYDSGGTADTCVKRDQLRIVVEEMRL